jgi:hypothetical protein
MKSFKEILEKGLKVSKELEQQTGFLIDDIEFYINDGEDILKKIPGASKEFKKMVADAKKLKDSMTGFSNSVAKKEK